MILLGVIQAINKLNGYFTKDDEGLLTILGNLAGIVLRNSISYDEQLLFHNSLRHILKANILFI
jgi:GAF domain-containing protein